MINFEAIGDVLATREVLAFLLTPYAVVVLMFFVASRFPVEHDAESEARLQRVALDDEA